MAITRIQDYGCKWLEHFIVKEMRDGINNDSAGREIIKWRVFCWKTFFKKHIENCSVCQTTKENIKEVKEYWELEDKSMEKWKNN